MRRWAVSFDPDARERLLSTPPADQPDAGLRAWPGTGGTPLQPVSPR
jgi:hypothetical protein